MIVTTVNVSQSTIKDTINRNIDLLGNKCNLNFIDTELITSMHYMFDCSKFNGDISDWDVGNVTDMMHMFYESGFNGDISNWNVGNVTDMGFMFKNAKFNGDISNWDVENVTNMMFMFYRSKFDGDISNWDVRNVTRISSMFYGCPLENRPEFQPKFNKEQYYDSNHSKGQSVHH